MTPYTNLVLNITCPPGKEVIVKSFKSRYYAPNKYDTVQLKDYLDDDTIYSLANFLEILYEYPIDEDHLYDLSDEELEEYKNINYTEFIGRYMHKRLYNYFQHISKKEFIVYSIYEGIDEENRSFTRIEFKYEYLKLSQ